MAKPTKLTVTKRVRKQGNSLCVNITHELGMIGLGLGDYVEVTIRKGKEDDA